MESVLVAVGSKTNSQLIIDVLKHNYDIQPYEKGIKIPSRLDLIIVDGRTLDSFRKRHIGLKNESDPVFLPILLITSKKGVGLMTGGMWRLVDEVITTPISKAELFARVEVLLRARRQSAALYRQNISMRAWRKNMGGKQAGAGQQIQL